MAAIGEEGDSDEHVRAVLCRAAAVVALTSIAPAAWAAAPDALDRPKRPAIPRTRTARSTTRSRPRWSCTTGCSACRSPLPSNWRGRARRARERTHGLCRPCERALLRPVSRASRDPARALYASAADCRHDARVFGALVNLSGDWASAFVVSRWSARRIARLRLAFCGQTMNSRRGISAAERGHFLILRGHCVIIRDPIFFGNQPPQHGLRVGLGVMAAGGFSRAAFTGG